MTVKRQPSSWVDRRGSAWKGSSEAVFVRRLNGTTADGRSGLNTYQGFGEGYSAFWRTNISRTTIRRTELQLP